MKLGKNLPILLLLLLLASFRGYASHIYGGELLYKHQGGNRYRIIVYLYGDCAGSRFPTLSYADALPEVKIYNNGMLYTTLHLRQDTLGIDISPVCPAERSNTTCNGGKWPGVKKFVYSDTVTLPPSAKWRIIFAGDMGSTAGRSFSITNIYTGSAGTTIQLEADLNNSLAPNSSPNYTTLPTPYYCINMEAQYNQGAIDNDGDSLAYRLIAGIDGNGMAPLYSSPVVYLPPCTADHPLITAPGGFSFNQVNGQLIFTPSAVQDALVDYQVLEYRNGVLVGSSMREMTFLVTDQCQASPAKIEIRNVQGGSATDGNVINICQGTPYLSFRLQMVNNGNDNGNLTATAVPNTASVTVNDNSTPNASADFAWSTGSLPIGAYTFFLIVKNDHCPISTTQTQAYTINVVAHPTISARQLSPTLCVYRAVMQFNLDKGYLPRTLTVTDGASVFCNRSDTACVMLDSFTAGNYIARVSCDAGCSESVPFSIIDSGKLPLFPLLASYCVGDIPQPVNLPPAGPGAIISWYNTDFDAIEGPPTAPTDGPGTYHWFVQESYKVCTSDVIPVTAEVHPLPEINIISRPVSSCFGDSVYLKASGGVQYAWYPENLVHLNTLGEPFVLITEPMQIRVKGVDINGCFNADTVVYDNIQQCCNFFYPTAFTPNGDGKNDEFRVMTYGNMFDYRLEIFNRWGERVYLTADPHSSWDGKKNGIPCDMGTYFYRFNGRCLTGKMETHEGDVTLIR